MKPQALFVAQPTYTAEINGKQIWDDLPLAAEEASKLASDLASHGYELSRQDLLKGGEKRAIEDALHDWFMHVAVGSRLILFWTGHGCSDGGKHYLVCRSSPKVDISSYDAISPDHIGEFIAKSKAEKILIILDTCHSGQGAGQIVNILEGILATRVFFPGQQPAYAIIASAHPLEEAQEAVFSKALRTAFLASNLPPDKRIWTDKDEFITADELAVVASHLMPLSISSPQCKASGLGQRFIPNPRYQVGLPAENVEERLWRLSRSDAAEHFGLAARGIEVGEKGWFFSGRKRLLYALVDWLKTAEHGVRIITGPPGAGKSAVMVRLATLSDAQYRQEAIDAGAVKEENDLIPPVGAIDVAVHAKGKTLDDCARVLAKGLRIELGQELSVDVEPLVENIGKLDRKITLLIDALDEAASGQSAAIALRLIVPLGFLPRVRIVMGSRRSLDGAVIPKSEDRHGRLRAAFGADAIVDDLEDEKDTHDDIADYVRLRLVNSEKHRSDDPVTIAMAAERVAARADGVFLYARIVSRTLQEQDTLDGELPATALAAFEQDLSVRFEGEERRVDDLLSALAWGEGEGLTRRVWPLVANALPDRERPYDDDDIAWVLAHAGWHIIEAGEDGQTVYHLAHQALADHYHGRFDEKELQGRIIAALTRGITGAGWLDCDRYLWRHLAYHAGTAGRLDELVRDPGYLAVANPARLIIALPSAESVEGHRFADVYDRVVDRLIGQSPIDRMPLIHMTAQMEDPGLAPAVEPPVHTRWRCRWARVKPSTPHRVIGRHDGAVNSIAFGVMDGAPVIVSGSDDGTIRRWDARTGESIGNPLEGHQSLVRSVAFGVMDGVPIVVSGGDPGTIRRWDARTGEPIGAPLLGHGGWVHSVAFGVMDGAPVIVSGDYNGTVRRWDARTGRSRPLLGHKDDVYSVAFGVTDGVPIIVSGSKDKTIRRWNARTGRSIGEPLKGHRSSVDSIALGVIDGTPVIVSGSDDGTIRCWDARRGEPIGAPLEGHRHSVTSVVFAVIGGAHVTVSGGRDKTIRRWDARTGRLIGRPVEGHTHMVNSVALGLIDGMQMVVSGGGGDDRTIQRWDAHTGEPIGAPLEGHSGVITSVTFGEINGAPIIVSGSHDGTIRRWDARTGEPIGAPLEHTLEGWIISVTFGEIDGAPIVVSRSRHTIRRWDARTGEPIGAPLDVDRVGSVAFGEIDGAPIIFSGDDETIYRWDARTGESLAGESLAGESIGALLEWRLIWASIALGEIDGAPVIVSGGYSGVIRRWDARTGESIGNPFEGHTGAVTSVAFGEINGTPVIVSCGSDNTVRCWDARAGESNRCSLLAIGDPVQAIDASNNGEVIVGMERGIFLLELFTTPQT